MGSSSNQMRRWGLVALALVVLGLIGLAVYNVSQWQGGRGIAPPKGEKVVITQIQLSQAPLEVQEAAAKLSSSRVAYAMPRGAMTYLIISSGESGESMELIGATSIAREAAIQVDLWSAGGGSRVIIAQLNQPVVDTRQIRFRLNGELGAIPALINAHNLPLTALPAKGAFALVEPESGARATGGILEVSGYARVFEGQFSIQLFSEGKGRLLGETTGVLAATGAPDWGSFQATVSYTLPAGITEGVLMVYDEESAARIAIPVRFGK